MLGGEIVHNTVYLILSQAWRQEIQFRTLEVFDVTSVQGTKFVRFRSDLDLHKIKDEMLKTRGVIVTTEQGLYEAILPDGRRGSVSAFNMVAVPSPNHRQTYRGTQNKFWDRQFPDIMEFGPLRH